MSLSISLLVLAAAFLHALWNALVKQSDDKTITLGLIALGHIFPGLFLLAPAPWLKQAALPYLFVGVSIHWLYFYLLNIAYRFGDLSVIYPLSRGIAPILVALGAAVWIGEHLRPITWIGIMFISAGILLLSRGILRGELQTKGIIAALGIGVIVATYTLVDGIGVRVAGQATTYIGWLFVAKILIVLYIFPTRMDRVRAIPNKTLLIGFLGGLISGSGYAIVLYAKSVAPLGTVSALRETSVIFAALIGVIWLGEGPKKMRIISAMIVAVGIVIIGLTE